MDGEGEVGPPFEATMPIWDESCNRRVRCRGVEETQAMGSIMPIHRPVTRATLRKRVTHPCDYVYKTIRIVYI
jgi:hypothetical protein